MKPAKEDKTEIIWVLIYTKVKQEKKANENHQKQGFKTFLPLMNTVSKTNKITSTVPVFPRYLFAQINLGLDNWSTINSSYGVSHIVMFGETFTSVPPSIIRFIQEKLNKEGIYKENISVVNYKKGDSLTIKEGLFAGVEAIFLSDKPKDRVRLLLKLLNTSVISEVDRSDIGHKEVVKKFKL